MAVIRFAASMLVSSAFLVPLGSAAQAPSLLAPAKTDGTPAPVTAPLCTGTAFNATLTDSLDTHKAKAGDAVIAEVSEDVTYERSVVLPKGTKIAGHIVRANSGGHGRTGSALFIQFDKAVLKDGQEVVLNAGIQALAANAVPPAPTDTKETAPRSLESQSPVEEPVTAEGVDDNGSLIVSTIYDASPRGPRPPLFAATAARGELNSDGLFTTDSQGAFGRPDLKIYTPMSDGSHGTVLLSAKKHMHLDSGTHLLLVVQPPPSGNPAQPEADANEATPIP